MFTYMTGDILESSAMCLVNTVNCEGYMGKGIAYQFKKRFPENNRDYMRACRHAELYIGTLHIYQEDGKIIVNFPTKIKWREKSKVEYIKSGMKCLVDFLNKNTNITSIAIPPLGCGNGGLKWAEIKPLIIESFSHLERNIDVQIHEPGVFVKTSFVKEPNKPALSHIILMSMKLKLKRKTKTDLQKNAFFFNLFAHEEFFKFKKYTYGPYSHSIDIISRHIKESQEYYRMNTEEYISFCKKQLMSKRVESKILKYEPIIEKSTRFINAFETTREVELVGTICYLLINDSLALADIIKKIQEWSERKKEVFSPTIIASQVSRLVDMNVLSTNLLGEYELAV